MSNSVDNRIVNMQFNNAQFERNVQTSVNSLDNLNKSLKLDGASNGLNALATAGRNFSLAGIASGVDMISGKFTALGLIGVTTLQNLTNSAIRMGEKFISSLTIDPIKTGFSEYETKMNAIATIWSNTKASGTSMANIETALQDLNAYSDKTIYNFGQMTDMVGKFAAKSGDLNSSVSVVKGMANLAAMSGVDNMRLQGALYQISQMSETVQSLDWSSMDTAGLATVKFRKDLLNMAKSMGTIDTATFDAINSGALNFRETLKDKWLTKGVFTAVTSMYAMDEAMTKTAGEVTTFTKLIGVMGEMVQSGWGRTWEIIVGGKDESTTMLTNLSNAFGKLIQPSTDARNAMFEFWKVDNKGNGGKESFIEGLMNIFTSAQRIIGAVKRAFESVFGVMDGPKLVSITNAFRDLTEIFKIGSEEGAYIQRTFKGIFSILNIGKTIFDTIVGGLKQLVDYFVPAGFSILEITANIGDFFVSLDKGIKTTDMFNAAISSFVAFVTPAVEVIKDLAIQFGQTVGVIGGSAIDSGTKALSAFVNDAATSFENLEAKIKNAIIALGEFKTKTITAIKANIPAPVVAIFEQLKKALGGIKESITILLKGMDINSVINLILGGALLAFVKQIKEFIGRSETFMESIIGVLDSVRDALKAYQSDLKASALMKIAAAVAILAGAILILSLINPDRLAPALAGIAALFASLFGSMAAFNAVVKGKDMGTLMAISVAMIGMAMAMTILAGALAKLSGMDAAEVAQGTLAMIVLSTTLVFVAKALEKEAPGLMKSSLGLNAFATALYVIVGVVERLGKIDPVKLMQGLVAFELVIMMLTQLLNSPSIKKMDVSVGAGFVALAVAMLVLSEAVIRMSSIDPLKLLKAVTAMGTILATLVLFVNNTKSISPYITELGVSLLFISVAMVVMAEAFKRFGELNPGEIAKGLVSIAGALIIITNSMLLLKEVDNMATSAVSLVLVSVALLLISKALKTMGEMDLGQIGKALLTLFGSLGIIAIAMLAMEGALPGAAALVIIAGALAILTPILMLLGTMSLEQLGMGLLALAGIFAVIGLSALVLAPLTPVIIALGIGMSLLGLGLMAVGAGMMFFATGLATLAVSGVAGALALQNVIVTIIGMIPAMATAVANGIVAFAQALATSAPSLFQAFKTILLALIPIIIDTIPAVVEAILIMVDSILRSLADHAPSMVESAFMLLRAFLDGLAANMEELTITGINIILAFIAGITAKLPDVVQAGIDLVITFINSVANGIRNNSTAMIAAMVNLMTAVGEAGAKVLTLAISSFKAIGGKIMDAIKNAISNKISDIKNSFSDMMSAGLDELGNTIGGFIDIGKNIVDGIVSGITGAAAGVGDAIVDVASGMMDAAKGFLGIHSPARMLDEEVGKPVDQGLAQGIINNAPIVEKAAKKVAEKTVDAAKEAFDKAVQWIEDRKYYNELTLKQELAAWEAMQKKYAIGSEYRMKIDKEMYRVRNALVKEEYDNSVEWIDDKLYYNKLSLSEELAAWERVQKRYKVGTDERKKADKEVYRLKKEMADKQAELEKDYYEKEKAIIDKRDQDIQDANDKYASALESRTRSLYTAYGLFDKVTKTPTSGVELIANLQDQIEEFESWQRNIDALTGKGVSQELIDELTAMGPKAVSQIQALNTLSGSELDRYVLLWKRKNQEAKDEAVDQLKPLENETIAAIDTLRINADAELDKYKQMWIDQSIELTGGVSAQLETLITTTSETVKTMGTEVVKEVTTISTAVQKAFSEPDWKNIGENMVLGLISGLYSTSVLLTSAAGKTALKALQAAKDALKIESPSKEFEQLGRFSNEGFANGLTKFGGSVVTAGAAMGNSAMDALRNSISNIASIVSGDMDITPTIRPVIDMTDVTKGLNSTFSKTQGINVSATVDKAAVVSNGMLRQNGSNSGNNTSTVTTNAPQINIKNTYTVRNDNDIRKISQDLNNTLTRYNYAKGVPV